MSQGIKDIIRVKLHLKKLIHLNIQMSFLKGTNELLRESRSHLFFLLKLHDF